jgi:hypothetical protein
MDFPKPPPLGVAFFFFEIRQKFFKSGEALSDYFRWRKVSKGSFDTRTKKFGDDQSGSIK